MLDITKYITKGLQNTLLFKNTTGTSHNGPWKQVYSNTLLDRWHVGEFSSVEYTISADFDVDNKEIIKVLITASRDRASVVIYARNNTGTFLFGNLKLLKLKNFLVSKTKYKIIE